LIRAAGYLNEMATWSRRRPNNHENLSHLIKHSRAKINLMVASDMKYK
jgi:hypothetical protein